MIDLRVSDTRQWTFCPRVLWHRYVTPNPARETPKMRMGREAEAALAKLEKRRSGRRYGLETAARAFDVALTSERLGVSGVCDLVLDVPASKSAWPDTGQSAPAGLARVTLTIPRRVIPVEVKRTEGMVSPHHAVQLAGYAMLLEERESLPDGAVDVGFVVRLPAEEVVEVAVDGTARKRFLAALEEIRAMLRTERFPDPTKHRSFCPQCEYVNFCGDVL